MDKSILISDISRFIEINRYTEKLLKEQTTPLDFSSAPEAAAPVPAEPTTPVPAEPTTSEPTTGNTEVTPNTEDDTTEEVDITDLVNMTKSIKQSIDAKSAEPPIDQGKMDDVFNKLNDLEQKLNLMDVMIQRIEELGAKIEDATPPTPQEKLEMRSLDSYPFNQKPNEFFNEKQAEMKRTGKNEYVLTKNDVENYSKNQIMNTFNPIKNQIDQSAY